METQRSACWYYLGGAGEVDPDLCECEAFWEGKGMRRWDPLFPLRGPNRLETRQAGGPSKAASTSRGCGCIPSISSISLLLVCKPSAKSCPKFQSGVSRVKERVSVSLWDHEFRREQPR